jgi:hypothetical protein
MNDKHVSEVFYNCFAEGVVSAAKCQQCFRSSPELQRQFVRRANCIKNNAEKEPTEF